LTKPDKEKASAPAISERAIVVELICSSCLSHS
jgi:hypothetical protein